MAVPPTPVKSSSSSHSLVRVSWYLSGWASTALPPAAVIHSITVAKSAHIRIYQEDDEIELEFISAPTGVNAESAASAIKDIGEDDFESKLSLKLLYGLTSDIKHLQYHGIDYLSLRVNPKIN